MELVIAQSVNDFASLEKLLSTSTDILALDQSAMVVLDAKGVKYKVTEDFYTADNYYQDACIYHQNIDSLFEQLDKACESKTNFPYAYSGNEQYFLTLFDDLLYLEKLIQTIRNKYEKIYLYATHKPKKISSSQFDFSKLNSYTVNGTISFPIEKTIERRIQLIYNSIDLCYIKDTHSSQKSFPRKETIRRFFNRLHVYFGKKFNTSVDTKCCNRSDRKDIYLIQDAYEVFYLKKYLSGFKYLKPVTELRQDIEMEQSIDMSDTCIDDILQKFIKKHFTFLARYFYSFIKSYHIEVVGRTSLFKEKFKFLIEKDKPSILLLSVGIRDVFDLVCCYVANYHHIPVIVFQHAGPSLFNYNPYHKSLEHNRSVLTTLITQSKESKFRNKETKLLCMGSIQQYEKNLTLMSSKFPVKGILFCLGPDANTDFRHLLNYYSINKKHNQSVDVISSVEDASLSLDIKLHPVGEKSSYDCYKNIIKKHQYKNINVLYGSFGEVISGNYKLIIIDYLGSALIRHILSLKIPVIIYDRDFDKARMSDNVLSDIFKRCYVARNKIELCELLERYKARNLPSKWNMDYIDKYIYPIDNGNPGENIAKYIDNIVK